MNLSILRNGWRDWLSRLPDWLTKVTPEAEQEAARFRSVERDLGLPVKGFILVLLGYYLLATRWFEDMSLLREGYIEVVQLFFVIYLVLNLVGGVILAWMNRLPLSVVREAVLGICLLDALFLGALAVVTGGYDSILFWVFLMLIVRNAMSLPQAGRQIVLNLVVTGCYLGAGILEGVAQRMELEMLDPLTLRAVYPEGTETRTEPVILRVSLLLLLTVCCYGVEVLFDKQRRADEEAQESAQRQQQLESAGRLAAEIAHQLKNPLSIINNAAFTLQRTVKEGKTITQQIRIIREEVERSDRIITELMGYARLVEGRVERLDVVEEIEQALKEVFPAAVQYEVEIRRQYLPPWPSLLMQRSHLSDVLVNLFQNAREALNGRGVIEVTARSVEGPAVQVTVADNGPGIEAEALERIFEAYYTTREKGSGLGLAIVKHNAELYGGSVRVETELGKGTQFILEFPAKTLIRLRT